MKKLLIFHPYLAPYRLDLYNKLSERYSLKVLLTGGQKEHSRLGFDLAQVNELADFDYEYYSKGFFVGRHLISFVYHRYVRYFKPNIVFAHEFGVNTLFSIFLKKFYNYKLFVTCDDSFKMASSYSFLRNLLRFHVLRNIDGLFVVNTSVKIFLEKRYHKFNFKCHYLPIIQDDAVFKIKLERARDAAQELKERYRLFNKKLFLFVGRLESVKAPDLVVQEMNNLIELDNDMMLLIVGDGSLMNELALYTMQNELDKHIVFLGKLTGEQLYACYNIADIFVLPSIFEPFGAVVNEALLSGCYTVVSDAVGSAELINQSNGVVFESGNPKDLSKKLKKTLTKISIPKDNDSKMPFTFDDCLSQLNEFIDSFDDNSERK